MAQFGRKLFLGTAAIGTAIACPILFPTYFGAAAVGTPTATGIGALIGSILGPTANAFGGVGGNVLADGVCELFDSPEAPADSPQNHHLSLAVGHAFAKVLETHRDHPSCAGSVNNIDALISLAPETFRAQLLQHNIAVGEVIDLPNLLAVASRDESIPPTLSVDDWEDWLRRLTAACGKSLDDIARVHLATQLHLNLFEQVRRCLKQDFERGGKAYAAFHMLCLGRLLDGMTRLLTNTNDILIKVNATAADISTIRRAIEGGAHKIEGATSPGLTAEERVALSTVLNDVLGQSGKLSHAIQSLIRIEGKVDTALVNQDRWFPAPFADIGNIDVKELFGGYHPTRHEFESGFIYEPRIAALILEKLKLHRCALVRGVSSSGKSVLAVQIALNTQFKGKAFYFDLGTPQGQATNQEITAAATALLKRDSLVIFDNVHLNENLVASIADPANRPGGFLLLIGRPALRDAALGSGSPLAKFEDPTLNLRPSEEALASTFAMVMRRSGRTPKAIPEEFLTVWFGWFGNKLWAFIRGVVSVAGDLGLAQPRWSKLRATSAVDAVRTTYRLDANDPPRMAALRRLAALQKYEISANSSVIDPEILRQEIGAGWIERTEHGNRGAFTRLRFNHPQEADLILEAMGNVNLHHELVQAASEHANTASIVAFRLLQQGRASSANAVLQPYVANSLERAGEYVFCWGFIAAISRAESLSTLGLAHLTDIDDAISKIDPNTLQEHLEDSALHHIASFLQRAESRLPLTHKEILERLAHANLWDGESNMAANVLRTPLDHTAFFLGYVEKRDAALHEAVLGVLRNVSLDKLAKRVMETPLDSIASFLGYVERRDAALHEAVLGVLRNESADRLAKRVMETPLENTAFFLGYVEKRDATLHEAVLGVLRNVSADKLAKRVMETPLDSIASFLGYVDRRDNKLHKAVLDVINHPTRQRHWGDRFAESTAEQTCTFLGYLGDATAETLVEGIQLDHWKGNILPRVFSQPVGIPNLLKLFNRLARRDLANATAIAALAATDLSVWHTDTVYLPHPATVLGFSYGADPTVVDGFMNEVLTVEWLDAQYSKFEMSAGTTAAAIFGVYCAHGPAIASRLRRPVLLERLKQAMKNPTTGSQGEPSHGVQLLGCCGLIDVRPNPSLQFARKYIQRLCEPLKRDAFGHIQQQFWLGLREIEPTSAAQLPVPHGALARAVEGFNPRITDTEHLKRLKNSMLHWLRT